MLLRDKGLSTDNCKVIDVIRNIFDLIDQGDEKFHQIWYMLPTCPLVSIDDIKAGIELLGSDVADHIVLGDMMPKKEHYDHYFDSVISITDVEFPVQLTLMMAEGSKICKLSHDLKLGNTRSQDFDKSYRPNGAFYGCWWNHFSYSRSFYNCWTAGQYMPRERSVDIDTELDLKLAELLVNEQSDIG